MSKKVSIIIPSYNAQKYIQETIDSCLNQTYENIEIIVVDDCSTDQTLEILKSYENKISLNANQTNQGMVRNLNSVTLSLESDYFIFLGHDDILPKKHVESMLGEFDDETVGVHCNSIIIDGDSKEIRLACNDEKQMHKTKRCLYELSIDNFISSCGMMHRTEVFKKLKGWSEDYKNYGEWLFYINELKHGKIKYTTKTRALYRRHETNITNSFTDKDVVKELTLYKDRCRREAYSLHEYSWMEFLRFILHDKIISQSYFLIKLKSFLYNLKNTMKSAR
ncbi:glycosyltransferase [bacterium]|nr:glycosyltransferase [bacterium]MBU1990833.1 glycosyltransferase [bacterium]